MPLRFRWRSLSQLVLWLWCMVLAIGFLVVRNQLQIRKSSSGREFDVSRNSQFSSSSCGSNSFSHTDTTPGTPLRDTRFHASKNMLGSLSHSRDSDDEMSIETKKYK